MAKRVYWEGLKQWTKDNKKKIGAGTSGGLITLFFLFLSMSGAIDITGYSGDEVCFGTEENPCTAIINFTANEDIFLYPTGYDPYGRNVSIANFDPAVKDWKLYRSWGDGWREIDLNDTCTGTWCGAPAGEDGASYSYAFREGRDYTLKIEALKENPEDKINWRIGGEIE